MFAYLNLQAYEAADIYLWILVGVILIIAIAGIYNPNIYSPAARWLSLAIAAIRSIFTRVEEKKEDGITLDEAIEAAGYLYDLEQDIFYSFLEAWQREMGYCRLYDEAAAPMGMIIDCEPIYFNYDDKRWMIEFWKGQYDMTTGCEIGVYTTEEPDLDIAGVFQGPFYHCASDSDLLTMSCILKKNGEILLTREAKHWWLTGFKLGEFSEPSELTMDLSITLKDQTMLNVFVKGLVRAGYSEDEIILDGDTVSLTFDKPRTQQPMTRTPETDKLIQRKNELLCNKYQEITGPYDTFPDKVNAIKTEAPELYEEVLKIGKTKQFLSIYEKIKEYLS